MHTVGKQLYSQYLGNCENEKYLKVNKVQSCLMHSFTNDKPFNIY